MIKRIGIAALAVVVLLAGGFFGYGYLSRRGDPSFSRGGAFGTTATPTPKATDLAARAADKTAPATESRRAPKTGRRDGPAAPQGTIAAGPAVGPPSEGRYLYAGEGSETIRFGSASPCSWDVDEATLDVKHTTDGTVFDWRYTDNHLERLVFDYGAKRVRLTFAGAAVTCLGVRNTSEEDYRPPTDWLRLPLKVGASWEQQTTAGDRDEQVTVKILRRERVTVPAGTFDAVVVRFRTELSGSEEGFATATQWLVPSLGLAVRDIGRTRASRGNIEFASDTRLELVRLP
jgi:hypothetical protein